MNDWLIGLLTQDLRLRMGYKVSSWTWIRGYVLLGNGTSLGIPYCHAISCIFFNKEVAEKYTNDCYKVNTYKACYEPIIDPING